MTDKRWETFAGCLSAFFLFPVWVLLGLAQMLIWILRRVMEFAGRGEA